MKHLLITSLSLISASLFAQQRGLDASVEIARKHFKHQVEKQQAGNSSQHAPRRNDVSPQLAYTARVDKQDAFYVFNSGDSDHGFVIVGADETTREVIAYTDHGSFDANNMPDNVRWWLSQYTEQYEQSRKAQANQMPKTVPNGGDIHSYATTVSPFLHAQWGQEEPFNNLIPKPSGYSANFPSGCAATAMAQVMHYYRYPYKGSGSKSYTNTYDGEVVTFEADFESTVYDWNYMLCDYFDGYYSDRQANAVATLMYHAGVACDMEYLRDASGAYTSDCLYGLVNHFGYDKGAYIANSRNYTENEWEQLIYNEIKAHRPVLYFGYDPSAGGHVFILHGYESINNLFDINWGWNSSFDGKYALDMMNPRFYDFNGAHAAIINLMPDTGIEPEEPNLNCYSLGAWINNKTISSYTISKDESISVDLSLEYNSCYPCSINAGFALQNVATHELVCIEDLGIDTYSKVGNHVFRRTSINTRNIKYNGTYKLVPLFRKSQEEDWKLLRTSPYVKDIDIVVSNKENPVKQDPIFTISATTIGKYQPIVIESPNYYGSYSITSSNRNVVDYSFDNVYGWEPGTAILTIKTTGDKYFNAIEKQFEITVTEEQVGMRSPSIELRADRIPLGWSTELSYDGITYQGEITCTCEPEGIVRFQQNWNRSTLTGINPGTTKVTFHCEPNWIYREEEKTYIVTVSDTYPDNNCIYNLNVPNYGYFCSETGHLNFSFTAEKYDRTEEPSRIYYELNGPTYRLKSETITPDYYHPKKVNVDWYIGSLPHKKEYEYYTLRILSSDKTTFIPLSNSEESMLLIDCPLLIVEHSTSGPWSTICLPFEADLPNGVIAYRVQTATDGTLDLIEVRNNHLEIGNPYILHNDYGHFTHYFNGPDIPESFIFEGGMLCGFLTGRRKYGPGDYILKEIDGVWGFAKATTYDMMQGMEEYTAVIHLDPESEEFAKNDFFRLNFVPRGDAYSDGEINVGDIIAIQQILNGNVYDQYNRSDADVNRDKSINEFDIDRLRRLILGY